MKHLFHLINFVNGVRMGWLIIQLGSYWFTKILVPYQLINGEESSLIPKKKEGEKFSSLIIRWKFYVIQEWIICGHVITPFVSHSIAVSH